MRVDISSFNSNTSHIYVTIVSKLTVKLTICCDFNFRRCEELRPSKDVCWLLSENPPTVRRHFMQTSMHTIEKELQKINNLEVYVDKKIQVEQTMEKKSTNRWIFQIRELRISVNICDESFQLSCSLECTFFSSHLSLPITEMLDEVNDHCCCFYSLFTIRLNAVSGEIMSKLFCWMFSIQQLRVKSNWPIKFILR